MDRQFTPWNRLGVGFRLNQGQIIVMDEAQNSTSSSLLAIFDIRDKRDLDQHCKTAVIYKGDLASLILACRLQRVPIGYVDFFKHHHPEDLVPTDADRKAFAENGAGYLSKGATKFVNKIGQMFEQRRLFCGHLFIPLANPSEWHLFYFDQRDTSKEYSHWAEGSHLHLMNMVSHPHVNLLDFVKKIDSQVRPKLGGGFHIRFAD